jgi:hypothetical protein
MQNSASKVMIKPFSTPATRRRFLNTVDEHFQNTEEKINIFFKCCACQKSTCLQDFSQKILTEKTFQGHALERREG